MMITKRSIKNFLGEIPFTAEAYWLLRQRGRPLSKGFSLRKVENNLPEWIEQANFARQFSSDGSSILIFVTLRYWIEHGVLLSMALSGLGHNVTFAYLPYTNWRKPMNRFDQRRQDIYARSVLDRMRPLVRSISFYQESGPKDNNLSYPYGLTDVLAKAVEEISLRDVQYTLQMETVDIKSSLYRLRLKRNIQAARSLHQWLNTSGSKKPDVILTPNGSILEMGTVYAVGRTLDIPVVTYEFGEQRGRIWLARNAEVMRQETGELWKAYQGISLTDDQRKDIRDLFSSRQQGKLWENFSRRWQGQPSQGSENVRMVLKLNQRPIVLLAANVIGDSLTLGRQVFSQSMTEWLEKSIYFFSNRSDVQLVVRIHPGERFTKGPSVAEVVYKVCPELPEHIHLVEAQDPINTYDIFEIANLGLVYTTTTGMEMAMSGVPVIISGSTHYRGKGFTLDPESWDSFYQTIENVLANPQLFILSKEQIELAWEYAFRFFFNYPLPFPWHLVRFWDELPENPLTYVLSPEGQEKYGEAFRCLAGEPRHWQKE